MNVKIIVVECLSFNLDRDVNKFLDEGYKLHGVAMFYRTSNVHSPQTIGVQSVIKKLKQ